jgi:hypothetical protein
MDGRDTEVDPTHLRDFADASLDQIPDGAISTHDE